MQLREQRTVISNILVHLSRRARIAKSLEESHAGERLDSVVGLCSEDYFDLLDPIGVEQRIQINRRDEEEFLGIETSY